MGDLSAHFSRHEFASKDGKPYDTVDAELLIVLEAVRDRFGEPVTIESGHRSPEHNAAVGGSAQSMHLQGRAADITVANTAPHKVHQWLDNTYPDTYGLGLYDSFVHIDTRKNRARWVG